MAAANNFQLLNHFRNEKLILQNHNAIINRNSEMFQSIILGLNKTATNNWTKAKSANKSNDAIQLLNYQRSLEAYLKTMDKATYDIQAEVMALVSKLTSIIDQLTRIINSTDLVQIAKFGSRYSTLINSLAVDYTRYNHFITDIRMLKIYYPGVTKKPILLFENGKRLTFTESEMRVVEQTLAAQLAGLATIDVKLEQIAVAQSEFIAEPSSDNVISLTTFQQYAPKYYWSYLYLYAAILAIGDKNEANPANQATEVAGAGGGGETVEVSEEEGAEATEEVDESNGGESLGGGEETEGGGGESSGTQSRSFAPKRTLDSTDTEQNQSKRKRTSDIGEILIEGMGAEVKVEGGAMNVDQAADNYLESLRKQNDKFDPYNPELSSYENIIVVDEPPRFTPPPSIANLEPLLYSRIRTDLERAILSQDSNWDVVILPLGQLTALQLFSLKLMPQPPETYKDSALVLLVPKNKLINRYDAALVGETVFSVWSLDEFTFTVTERVNKN